MIRLLTYVLAMVMLASCNRGQSFDAAQFAHKIYSPIHADGFQILGCEGSSASLIVVNSPWQGAEQMTQMLLIDPEDEFRSVDGNVQRISHYAQRIVCMSSSYVAMLSAIGKDHSIVGVSGIDFISNDYVKANRNKIGDVGYDNNINYELLVALDADLVLLYGVTSANMMESKLKELQIPYIYLGEYIEPSPLGKAEWIVAIGEITGQRKRAESEFGKIAERYETLSQEITSKSPNRPRVMLNTPYRDSWFIPSEQSYMVRLIKDAGAECYTTSGSGNASQPIDIEQAYIWASLADYWLNVGPCNSLDELTRQNPKFADVMAVKEQRVYNNNARQTPAQGSDFWESGIVRPDRILYDLVNIFHPEYVEASDTENANQHDKRLYYYKQLK